MTLRLLQFAALVLTALALVPAGAHLFTLPNKMTLSADQYFIVQQIYRGWALFGLVLLPALIVTLVVAILRYGDGAPFWLTVAATLLIALNLAIFFAWTYPANVATENWTQIPQDWDTLRSQWEYSHAANAILLFFALSLTAIAALIPRR